MTIFQQRSASTSPPQIIQLIDARDHAAGHQHLASTVAARLLEFGDCNGQTSATARREWRSLLTATPRKASAPLWIGLHRLDDEDEIALDLTWALEMGAEGVALPCAHAGSDLQHLHVLLDVAEAEWGAGSRSLSILAMAGDNPTGLLAAGSFAKKSDRLVAIGWHGGRLAEALRDDLRTDAALVTSVRTTIRLAAAAAGVAAVDWTCDRLIDDTAPRSRGAERGLEWLLVQQQPSS